MSKATGQFRIFSEEELRTTNLFLSPQTSDQNIKTASTTVSSDKYISTSIIGSNIGVFKGSIVVIKKIRSIGNFSNGLEGLENAIRVMSQDSDKFVSELPFKSYLCTIQGCLIENQGVSRTLYLVSVPSPFGTLGQVLGITSTHSPFILSKKTPSNQQLNAVTKASIILDLFTAVSFLHANQVTHGFLNIDNVLVYPGYRIKLFDYGWLNACRYNIRNLVWESNLRFLAPELCAYLRDCEAFMTQNSNKNAILAPTYDQSIDVYSIGAVIVSILTGKRPFVNLDDPCDVMSQILSGETPLLPSSYPDKDHLIEIEEIMMSCLSSDPLTRPRTVEPRKNIDQVAVVTRLRNVFIALETQRRIAERDKRAVKIDELELEIADFETKIRDLEDIVSNGQKLIKQRQNNLVLIFNAQERRDAEAAIERAFMKLKKFEEDLEGNRLDLNDAKEDLAAVTERQRKVLELLEGGPSRLLKERDTWDEAIDWDGMLDRFCSSRDRGYLESQLTASETSSSGAKTTRCSTASALEESLRKNSRIVRSLGEILGKEFYVKDSMEEVSWTPASSEKTMPTMSAAPQTARSTPIPVPVQKVIATSATSPPPLPAMDSDDDDISVRNMTRARRSTLRFSVDKLSASVDSKHRKSYLASVTVRGVARAAQLLDSDDDSDFDLHSLSSLPSSARPSMSIQKSLAHAPSKIGRSMQPRVVDSDDDISDDGRSEFPVKVGLKKSVKGSQPRPSRLDQITIDSDDDTTTPNPERPQPFERDSDDDDTSYDEEVDVFTLGKPKSSQPRDSNAHFLRNSVAAKVIAKTRVSQASKSGHRMTGHQTSSPALSPLHRSSSKFSASHGSVSVDSSKESFMFVGELSPWEQLEIEYCAAAKGSWEEAIGMKVAGIAMDERIVQNMVDRMETPVHIAALRGHVSVLRQLVSSIGFEPWTFDGNQRLPLHNAARRGHVNVVKYLLEECSPEGAVKALGYENAADVPDGKGITPLIWCVVEGHLNVLTYLLEHAPLKCSAISTDPEFGASLLHWACLTSQLPIATYLVDTHYVSIEAKAKVDGSTPVFWATYGGTVDVMSYLIKRGAKLYPRHPPKGLTCLHLATACGNTSDEGLTPFDVATGKCEAYLKQRKDKGFLTGSVVDKVNKSK